MSESVDRVTEIAGRVAAATEGPWHWAGNTDNRSIYLATWRPGLGRCTIMDFARWGMQSALPRFDDDLMMIGAEKLVTYEVAPNAKSRQDPKVYRADIDGIRHPDAILIANAKADIEYLLDRLRTAEAERGNWKRLCASETLAWVTATKRADAAEAREAEAAALIEKAVESQVWDDAHGWIIRAEELSELANDAADRVLSSDWLARVKAEARERALTEVVTDAAREHWDWAERRREKFNDEGCICALCGILRNISDLRSGVK